MAMIDTDGNGTIDYSEFVIATINKQILLSKNNIEAAFEAFDKDGNGSISIEEIKMILGNAKIEDETLKALIYEFDIDGNGEIELNEFV
jgi:calcium-dependent protein kinase